MVFVHCRAEGGFCAKADNAEVGVGEAVAVFCKKYKKKCQAEPGYAPLETAALYLLDAATPLTESQWRALDAKADVFACSVDSPDDGADDGAADGAETPPPPPALNVVATAAAAKAPAAKAATAPAAKPTEPAAAEKPAAQKAAVNKPAAQKAAKKQAPADEQEALIAPWLVRAEACREKGALRSALGLMETVLRVAPQHLKANALLGNVFFDARQYDKAAELFRVAKDAKMRGLSLLRQGLFEEAIDVLKPLKGDEAALLLAEALLSTDQHGQAISLIEAVLAKDDRHARGICLYAKVAKLYSKLDDEISLLLRGIVISQRDAPLRAALAAALEHPGGVSRLRAQLAGGAEPAAAAVAFLATICKDHGACGTAVELLAWAAAEAPASAAYALNLAHAHEVLGASEAAFSVCAKFLEAPRQDVDVSGFRGLLGASLTSDDVAVSAISWVTDDGPAYAVVGETAPVALRAFGEDALEVLALLFLLVKLLYLEGRWGRCAALIKKIEPLRRSSTTPLHQTNVRNEAAYYCCVAQLVSRKKKPDFAVARRQVYVCGDSHALAPAWSVLDVGEEEVLLHPALVTGLKHWHLRPACAFYPKRNFHCVMGLDDGQAGPHATSLGLFQHAAGQCSSRAVPVGASVIFVLGEIDCREGILVAVEKLKYDTIDDGEDRALGEANRQRNEGVSWHMFMLYYTSNYFDDDDI